MHDIGKIGIPDRILQKRGPLDDAEWKLMREHTAIGASILGRHDNALLDTARMVALTHHERWDGAGYPLGLKGEAIPLAGRIVAIADVFDALTSERPYKGEWPVDQAVAYLREHAGAHFDPALTEKFIGVLPQVMEIKDAYSDVPVRAHM
jgi:putative two-component system response regulator